MDLGAGKMKTYEDLTQRGKLRRTGRVARAALEAFGFTEARLRLMVDAGNTTYRVKAVGRTTAERGLYVDDCYSLRLHQPGYQNYGAVDSELEWLFALSEAGLPVPQPIPTKDGELSVEVSVPGAPARRCSLLRWVKGRMAPKLVRPWHMKAIGRLIAQLQNHASSWRPPPGFVRRHYDRNGLWGDDTGTGYAADEVWPKIPRRYFEAFQEVTTRVEQVMEDWGKGPDVYGLIHADLGTEANVLFHRGEARAIDFDDGGYGYWVYDLAVPLVDLEGKESLPTFRDALLDGYTEIRSIPEEQLEKLELFQAAFRALEIFWGTACTLRNPDSTYWMERREKAWMHIKHALRLRSI
jgi:Ser/Thr protein kinase RdoA (MazF antagonist)